MREVSIGEGGLYRWGSPLQVREVFTGNTCDYHKKDDGGDGDDDVDGGEYEDGVITPIKS